MLITRMAGGKVWFSIKKLVQVRGVFYSRIWGDNLMIRVTNIRITQDWNRVHRTWKTWLFLKVLEEFQKGGYFNFLPIQFWFDFRQKESFQKLGEWISDDKELWNVLVCDP